MRVIKRPEGSEAAKAGRILYVEDDDLNWTVMRELFADQYNISRARTDEEFFAAVSNYDYDVVLMDIELSGSHANGIELVRQARDKNTKLTKLRDVPIVFVTAYSALYSRQQLLEYGADDVTFKPVNPTGLK